MHSSPFKETVFSIAILALGVLAINPSHMSMSVGMHMTLFALLFVAVALFAGFILGERVHDERESEHRSIAGRVGYLFGLFVIVIAIVIQAYGHRPVDTWLIVALMAMIIGNIIARIVRRIYH